MNVWTVFIRAVGLALILTFVVSVENESSAFCNQDLPGPLFFFQCPGTEGGSGGHKDITSAGLPFLKETVRDDIIEKNEDQDLRFNPFDAKRHFDDCLFLESTQYINDQYSALVAALDPTSPRLSDATNKFGRLLHPAQDFYSHSNWVELERESLIDDGFDAWTPLEPFSQAKGVFIVQGDPAGFELSRTDFVVTVESPSGSSNGLITGAFNEDHDCPSTNGGVVTHGELHKDSSRREPRYTPAKDLAVEQTTHEWCRLVNRVKKSHGRRGVEFLFDSWVDDSDAAISACPNADIAFVIDTTGSMADDIAAVKAAARDIIDALNDRPVLVRLALATYKDFPQAPFGGPSDFPFRAELDFTLGDNIKDAIDSLDAGGGGDLPESVYTALMETMGGGLGTWRADADVKAIILIGDAPPHDPEPFSGFTLADVIQAALAADPIVIYGIRVDSSTLALESFADIAEGTGGSVFTAETASDVPDAVTSAIEQILPPTIRNTDVVSAGFGGMRGIGTGSISVGGVTGSVSKARLYWHGPTNSSDPTANASVTFAGTGVIGTNIGFSHDNCWAFSNSQAYLADVTSLVTGDGSYSLSGFAGPAAEINGASLIVFFDDGDDANNRNVILFEGNDSNEANIFDADGWNIALPVVDYTSGAASIELHVSDGQVFNDDALILNGSTTLAPTGPIFQGDSVPNGPGGAGDGGLWDIKSFDITSSLAAGPETLTLTTGFANDCLSLVVAAVSLPAAGPEPPDTPTPTLTPTPCPSGKVPVDSGCGTPTPTQTPCPAGQNKNPSGCKTVGGIEEAPEVAGLTLEAPDSSGSNTGRLAGVAIAVAAGAVTLGGAAWYVRRRWLR